MWRLAASTLVISILLSGVTTQAQRIDITRPGDRIKGVPNDGDWPSNEAPQFAIDDDIGTKYLHFKGDFYPDPGTGGTGLRVTPSARQTTVVIGLTFTTANDFPGRDPIAFELSGSNSSIDGPYSPIVRGAIVDFNQEKAWPRFTKNETPILFRNGSAYNHYQLIFTAIRGPAGGLVNSVQIAEVELLAMSLLASDPSPSNGALCIDTAVKLRWTGGATATSHDVYFGDNFEDVYAGTGNTFRGNRTDTDFCVGIPGYPHPDGLDSDTTYYWRIDEVEADGMTMHKGEVWNFTTADADGAPYPDSHLPVTGMNFSSLNAVDLVLLAWLGENGFEAATIGIMKDRRLVYRKGYGWQNADKTQPISPSAVMRLASNTKPITARAIQQLIEDRVIQAGDKVYDLLDISPISGARARDGRIFDITIQHILDHKSGLIRDAPGTGQLGRMLGLGRPATMAETIAYTWTQNLLFSPGSDSQYSNLGYQILGHVIETVSGQTYEEYIREQIAQPLGITTFQVAGNGMNNEIENEIWYAGDRCVVPEIDVDGSMTCVAAPYAIDMEARPGAGSLVSSTEDFCRFLKSYFHTGPPKPQSLSGISWTYTFFGSLPGTLTATRDIINPDGSSIVYAVLVNERIDGRADILPDLVSDLDALLINLEDWPDVDLFLIDDRLPPQPQPGTDPLSEAMDTTLSFATGGDADWFAQTTTSCYGPESAQSGGILHGQETWMQTTVSGTGTLSFLWKVSSEDDFDFLEFYIDGSLRDRITGSVDWHQMDYEVTGSYLHVLEWRYVKDMSTDFGDDCGWVDFIQWTGPSRYSVFRPTVGVSSLR